MAESTLKTVEVETTAQLPVLEGQVKAAEHLDSEVNEEPEKEVKLEEESELERIEKLRASLPLAKKSELIRVEEISKEHRS